MLRSALFIACVALLIVAINHWALYRAENELLLRMCSNQEEVVSNLRAVLLNEVSKRAIRETRKYMIAAKLMFIIPRQKGEQLDAYIHRIRSRLEEKCQLPAVTPSPKPQ